MRISAYAVVAALVASSLPAAGKEGVPPQVRTLFQSMDLNDNGRLSQRELNAMRDAIFLSMDANDDGVVDQAEFVAWGIGESAHDFLPQQSDRLKSVKSSFFADTLDQDGDRVVTEEEFMRSHVLTYIRSDADSDGSLTLEEFYRNDPLLQGIGNALTAE